MVWEALQILQSPYIPASQRNGFLNWDFGIWYFKLGKKSSSSNSMFQTRELEVLLTPFEIDISIKECSEDSFLQFNFRPHGHCTHVCVLSDSIAHAAAGLLFWFLTASLLTQSKELLCHFPPFRKPFTRFRAYCVMSDMNWYDCIIRVTQVKTSSKKEKTTSKRLAKEIRKRKSKSKRNIKE